ncbi:MAG: hypothetical protein M5U31_16455, partial [Acidimicrobiia bacterium]|nr:hypothetical protein [Acidimicrobiia bacterium]
MRGANVKLVSEDPGEFTPIPDSEDDLSGYFGPGRRSSSWIRSVAGGGGAGTGSGSSVVLRAAQDENVCRVIFDRDPESVILRQNDVGELEIWTEGGRLAALRARHRRWLALTLGAHALRRGRLRRRRVAPPAAEREHGGCDAGGDRVEIASFEDLDLVAGTDEWFAVGDRVVVNPGADNENTPRSPGSARSSSPSPSSTTRAGRDDRRRRSRRTRRSRWPGGPGGPGRSGGAVGRRRRSHGAAEPEVGGSAAGTVAGVQSGAGQATGGSC